jgi:hypothetical protein
MENRQRLLVFALVGVLAVLGGFAAGAILTGGSGAADTTPSPVALASATPSPTSVEPSEVPSTEATAAVESPVASPTAATITRARVTFTDLRLDAADDPSGEDRVFRFVTGPGPITVDVKSITAPGNTIMCLNTLTKELGCRTAKSGQLSAKTTKPQETFLVTLRGQAVAQPVVQVRLTFPAKQPSVIVEHARFDGTDYPETNGISATFTARSPGSVGIKAEWGGHPFNYQIDLSQQGQPGTTTYEPDEANIGTDQSFDLQDTGEWTIVLRNADAGFGITPMTATLNWP